MTFLIIEVFICIGFILLFYQCCVKGARARQTPYDNHGDGISDNNEDLRRFRERMSERGRGGDHYPPQASAAGDIAARKELIETNLFSRQIHREESVKELSQLLAISRGGVVDEELGLGECADPAVSSGGDGTTLAEPTPLHIPKPDLSASTAASESSLPTPSAPPSTAAGATTDTIATALSSPPEPLPPNNIPPKNPITLEPIRNLWSNLTQNNQSSERGETAAPQAVATCQTNVCTNTSNAAHEHKLECSICLDQYSPNETIAWAKDGGDPPTLSSLNTAAINNDVGCDHIFHKECLVSWLENNDECPLCRRKVVHTDVDVRFAGWEM